MNTQDNSKFKVKSSKLREIFGIPTDKLWIYPAVFGLAAGLYKITASSIWHDEGYTLWLIRYNPLQIIARTARDVHPPLYYLIAHLWTLVFGRSELGIRSLSLVFFIGIIYLVYKVVEKLFNERAAFWASMLVALSPFMVRFAQESRMYGMVAFLTTLGTYFLVRYFKEKNDRMLIFYALSMAAAAYTQYYAFFIIMVQWIAVAAMTPGFFRLKWREPFKKHLGIFNLKWLAAGLAPIILFLPWAPVAYGQVTRVSTSYWIRPEWITAKTIPNSLTEFIIYAHLDSFNSANIPVTILFWFLILLLVASSALLLLKKEWRKKIGAFLLYGYLPMILVFILSKVKTPVYQDRYFPFSAVAILALWGIGIAMVKNKYARMGLATVAIAVLLAGNIEMHAATNHQMKALSEAVKKQMKPGDIVLSGELYTFLDGSYYFGDKNIRLISDPVDGYGESSLFYDQQSQYVVSRDQALALEASHRVFIIGKIGNKPYFSNCLVSGRTSKVIYEENNDDGLKAVLYE